MQKPGFTWPLIATLFICLLSLVGVALLIFLTQPALLTMLEVLGGSTGERLLFLSPLIALYLFGVFSWICLVRIFLRRSRQTARLFLFVLALLLAVAFPFAWTDLGVHSLWLALWFAGLVALFFALGRD